MFSQRASKNIRCNCFNNWLFGGAKIDASITPVQHPHCSLARHVVYKFLVKLRDELALFPTFATPVLTNKEGGKHRLNLMRRAAAVERKAGRRSPRGSTRYISSSAASGREKFLNAAVQTTRSKSIRRDRQFGGIASFEGDVDTGLARILIGNANEALADIDTDHFPPLFLVVLDWMCEPETSALRAFGLGLPAPAVFQHRRGSAFCV